MLTWGQSIEETDRLYKRKEHEEKRETGEGEERKCNLLLRDETLAVATYLRSLHVAAS